MRLGFFGFIFGLVFISLSVGAKSSAKEKKSETFEQWKRSYAERASKHGIPKAFTLKELANVKIKEEVVKKDKNQVVFNQKKDYQKFIKKWLREKPSRIEEGKKMLKKYRTLLAKVEKHYGVEKEVIVALWGVETFYGKILGSHDLVQSLATLAYDGRRRRFFEIQLNAALRWIYKGHVARKDLKGSWAGATGHCQFMPSNIPVFGQDFNGDGKIDLWNTKADVFASIAYYLKKNGWKKGKSIGSLVNGPEITDVDFSRYRTKSQYAKMGFTEVDGSELGAGQNWIRRKAETIPMENSPVVLKGSNYKPITRWNRSSLFVAFNITLVDAFTNSQ